MKTEATKAFFVAALLFVGVLAARSQGSFVNLDFEHPILPLTPVNFLVPISNALPRWTGDIGGVQVDRILYNTVSIGSSEIDLQGPGSLEPILQGSYTVGMGASAQGLSTAIAQVGTIPANAKSLSFYVYPGSLFAVTFAGQPLVLTTLGSTSAATILGGDITAFAGQTGELRFQGGGELDYIQFSDLPIPEASAFGLSALGALLLGWRALRRRE